jgi:hypothetical protein
MPVWLALRCLIFFFFSFSSCVCVCVCVCRRSAGAGVTVPGVGGCRGGRGDGGSPLSQPRASTHHLAGGRGLQLCVRNDWGELAEVQLAWMESLYGKCVCVNVYICNHCKNLLTQTKTRSKSRLVAGTEISAYVHINTNHGKNRIFTTCLPHLSPPRTSAAQRVAAACSSQS